MAKIIDKPCQCTYNLLAITQGRCVHPKVETYLKCSSDKFPQNCPLKDAPEAIIKKETSIQPEGTLELDMKDEHPSYTRSM